MHISLFYHIVYWLDLVFGERYAVLYHLASCVDLSVQVWKFIFCVTESRGLSGFLLYLYPSPTPLRLTIYPLHVFDVYRPDWVRCVFTFLFLDARSSFSRKISTDRTFSENIIVKSFKRKFSTSKFFSDGKFVSEHFTKFSFCGKFSSVEMGLSHRKQPEQLKFYCI
jgi:hypothetical protein